MPGIDIPGIDIPGMAIPGIGVPDRPPVLGLGSGCVADRAGMSMPGMAGGMGAALGGIGMLGKADGADGIGAPLDGMSIPGMDCGVEAAGALISMPRIGVAGAAADLGVARSGARFALRFWVGWAPLFRGCGLAPGFAFALAAGLAGIFIPGMDMPPMDCAAAAPGSSVAAATAASHLFLII
ncbi:MAG TPA: hypothetical protein VF485_16645 [Sphingomonas sp.]